MSALSKAGPGVGRAAGSLPGPGSGPPPRQAARAELTRALLGVAGLPLRLAAFAFTRARWRAALAAHLSDPAPPLENTPPPTPERFPARPLRIFLSSGETSSAGHAGRVAQALRNACQEAGAPPPELFGLGPPSLAEQGVDCIGDPTGGATMGGQGVWSQIPFYLDLLESAAHALRNRQPDVFVPVDAPALHVPLAHMAQRYGVPSVHLVAPQYWAWGPWRLATYRRIVTRALTIFPWEPGWFEDQGIRTAHVGHPQMDVLGELGPAPSDEQRSELVLLPGSRRGEVEVHLPWMLAAVRPLAAQVPDLRVTIAQSNGEHTERIERMLKDSPVPAALEVGDLHGTLGRARAALAVSGTVLTDLLHHRLPAVVIYSMAGRLRTSLVPKLLTTPFFSTTNLLAGREILPERSFRAGTDGPLEEVGALLGQCYNEGPWRTQCQADLARAAERIGPAGAARRTALHVLDVALGNASLT